MSWSKVQKPLSHPIGWWYHKVMAELSWHLRPVSYRFFNKKYYNHVLKMVWDYKANIYGTKLSVTTNDQLSSTN
jgi:hypothetical protein